MSEILRRLRRTPALRELMRETSLEPRNLIYPIFVREGLEEREEISSMPGQYRLPIKELAREAKELDEAGVGAVLLFGLPLLKDERATASSARDGVVCQATGALKDSKPELVVMTDVCVCAYMDHGHCGVVRNGVLDQAATLPLLAHMAVAHADAGADVVAPSSMVDSQVRAVRQGLDAAGHHECAVMAYASKFASAFYGPFREAADSSPSFGDRSSYQHDFANGRHAKRELAQDVIEGADILMVKPALSYLDIVSTARREFDLPIAAYSVSGEYSMIKAASQKGWLDERKIVLETLTAMRRAGADMIITYFAKEAARWLNES